MKDEGEAGAIMDFESFHVIDPGGWDLQISNKTSSR